MDTQSLFKYISFCAPEVVSAENMQEKYLQEMRVKGFENGEIWYPKASNLNDPYECYPDFVLNEEDIEQIVDSLTPEEFIFIKRKSKVDSKKKILKAWKTPDLIRIPAIAGTPVISTEFIHRPLFLAIISALSTHYLSKIGILSLTTNPLDVRMWAHYGGNSTGICIEFERTGENALGSKSTLPVTYAKFRKKFNFHERHSRKEEIITTKSVAWSDEEEWRHWEDQGDKLYPFPGKILRVMFGLNCNPNTIEITKSIFGKDVDFEEVLLGSDYTLSTDKGLRHSLSRVEIKWPI